MLRLEGEERSLTRFSLPYHDANEGASRLRWGEHAPKRSSLHSTPPLRVETVRSAGAPFRNMLPSVAELSMLFLVATRGREERDGRSLCHTFQGSACKKRDTLVAQPLRMNRLPRNFCVTSRFCKRNRAVFASMRVWQVRSPARSSLPPPRCLHKQ